MSKEEVEKLLERCTIDPDKDYRSEIRNFYIDKEGNLVWQKYRRIQIFPWQTSTDPHDCISKSKTSHPYILQTL